MSKYSIKDKVSAKLENNITENTQSMAEKDDLTPEEIAKLTPDEFEFVEYDESEAERAGYSNYSYWRSTVRMFFKNKVAGQFGDNAGACAVHVHSAPASESV